MGTVPQRETLDLPELCAVLGIGQTKARQLIKAGVIPAIYFGRRVVVACHVLDMILTGDLDVSGNGEGDRAA